MHNDEYFKVDVGCGPYKRDGFIGVDLMEYPTVDIIADCFHLPFKEHCVDLMYCLSLLEHFSNPYILLEEIYRVLKTPRGVCDFIVPNVGTYSAESDPTHLFVTDLVHWHLILESFFYNIKVRPFGVKFQSSSLKWIIKQIDLIQDGLWDLAQGFGFRCTHSKPPDFIEYQYVPYFMEEYAREIGRTYYTPRKVVLTPLLNLDLSEYTKIREELTDNGK